MRSNARPLGRMARILYFILPRDAGARAYHGGAFYKSSDKDEEIIKKKCDALVPLK